MKRYKQAHVPVVNNKQFDGMRLSEIRNYVEDYFIENLEDKTVVNKHKGISVEFNRAGIKHVLYARKGGYVKYKAIMVADEMIENAVLCNYKKPDDDDGDNVLGYFNFKCKAKIEGRIQIFRIVIRLVNDGKFYYDHALRVLK